MSKWWICFALKGLTQPENTSFCAATSSSSYQPPLKRSKIAKKYGNSKQVLQPKSEPQETDENELNEELIIEPGDYFSPEETPFLKSFEPIFTLKDQGPGEKLRFICNRCPNMDENGKF